MTNILMGPLAAIISAKFKAEPLSVQWHKEVKAIKNKKHRTAAYRSYDMRRRAYVKMIIVIVLKD